MANPSNPLPFWTVGRMTLALAIGAGVLVVGTLDGPGITSDEPLDVRVGRAYIAQAARILGRIEAGGWERLGQADLDAMFRDNAQHPPLGRWLVGIASTLAEPFETLLGGPDPFSVLPARLAPALAFAILVGLVVGTTGHRYGRGAGLVAGFALLAMPRVFAHAHFATLDTFLALFWTLALIGLDRACSSRRPIAAFTGAGVLWGLALLTKIHAWFLPPLALGYALARLPWRRALLALAGWTAAGLAVFTAGWPWLWFDSISRLRGFLSTSVVRLPLKAQYFGEVYLDKDLPWHYPWFYFAVTVPIGLQVLGGLGLVQAWRNRRADPFPILLLASIGVFLVLFSTRAPVYDGERLFVHVFPAWAIVIGLGFRTAWDASRRIWLRGALVILLLAQAAGTIGLQPFGLSYYNILVGGLPGAERMGLELTYWGDTIDRMLLNELAQRADPGDVVVLAPSLHAFQPLAVQTSALHAKNVTIVEDTALSAGRDVPSAGSPRWLLVYRRSAYWRPELLDAMRTGHLVAERSRQGVWLARLYELSDL